MKLLRYYQAQSDHLICYYVQATSEFDDCRLVKLLQANLQSVNHQEYCEIGPRIGTSSPWGGNTLTILHRLGLTEIIKIEKSRMYPVSADNSVEYDSMTEEKYPQALQLNDFTDVRQPDKTINIELSELSTFNELYHLGMDGQDIEWYQRLFAGRSLTDVELFDLAQSNSEHSRHWLFRGELRSPDGYSYPGTLFQLIKKPLQVLKKNNHNDNSLVAMSDNSSAIRGCTVEVLIPDSLTNLRFSRELGTLHPILTAETHNFPTGIAPFQGSATGVGGRIRDIQGMGRGGQMIAGIAGYSVGHLPYGELYDRMTNEADNSELQYVWKYPLHDPLTILIEASNGASDYGNKIGEPLIGGFTRSFGQLVAYGTEPYALSFKRIEYIKPIMFSAGVGQVFEDHLYKKNPECGYLIVRLGGPAFRIGVGGGAASSRSQASNMEVDLCAVQRGDAEMENRLAKVLRTCIEMGEHNPILSIHDQGAGGMGNVTKEIVSEGGVGTGGMVSLANVVNGDPTLSAREKWIAEYQEQDTILIHPKDAQLLKAICQRENLPISFVGVVTNDGKMSVYDSSAEMKASELFPVDLELDQVLGHIPQKVFNVLPTASNQASALEITSLQLKGDLEGNLPDRLDKIIKSVLLNVTVGSKRFLTNKVDRSVSGLVAQQQCVGPLQTPLSNYSLVAQSHYGFSGIATSVGEQPIKGLLDPRAMARMTVGEMLTNLVWVKVSRLADVKCSGNWMWEKKIPQEVDALRQAVESLSECLIDLGIAIDGGKDSLSMSAESPIIGGMVPSPRTLVMTAYATVPDIRVKVTPDLKRAGNQLLYIDLGNGRNRLGGSIWAYENHWVLGDRSPNLDNPELLKRAFNEIQMLLGQPAGLKIWSGHDRSDGGLITTLLEMSFAGNLGWEIRLDELVRAVGDVDRYQVLVEELIPILFAEELGLVLEVSPDQLERIKTVFVNQGLSCYHLGEVLDQKVNLIRYHGQLIYYSPMTQLRDCWEWASFQMELKQCAEKCVLSEQSSLGRRNGPQYNLGSGFEKLAELAVKSRPLASQYSLSQTTSTMAPRIAIIREEGSNGDREMAVAFDLAGFEVHDVTMTDLVANPRMLELFRGLALVGGFSFADVLGGGRGWYLTITENPEVAEAFQRFKERSDTFSLGVCNGCQVMSQLGWVPGSFVRNDSGRFESRWSTVRILPSNSIMLKDLDWSVLGVWVAHGEGRYVAEGDSGIPIQYVLEDGNPSLVYPDNPNGSDYAAAGVVSADGRHLAMMPHPERTVWQWQAPWISSDFQEQMDQVGYVNEYPWLELFRNAYRWCMS